MNRETIAIDTNVLLHSLNPEKNTEQHISKILAKLYEEKYVLLVDETHGNSYIRKEYKNRVWPAVKHNKKGDMGPSLLHFLDPQHHLKVDVEMRDPLTQAIKTLVRDTTDRIFVYVAFKHGCTLMTNDRKDIIDYGNIRYERRRQLLRIPKTRGRHKDAKICTSEEYSRKISEEPAEKKP